MKIGLFGVGHLGKIHLKCLLNTDFIISGFYDPDDNAANEIIKNHALKNNFKFSVDSENTFEMDNQFMLGNAILMKPVSEPGQKSIRVYLPNEIVILN